MEMDQGRMYDEESLLAQAKQDGIERFVVGGIVVNDERSVLLLRRRSDDFMGGVWELPSGKVEDDESLEDALYREMEEETGLRVLKIEFVGNFDYESKSGRKTRQFNFIIEVDDDEVVLSSEHEELRWVGRNHLSSLTVTREVKKILHGVWEKFGNERV